MYVAKLMPGVLRRKDKSSLDAGFYMAGGAHYWYLASLIHCTYSERFYFVIIYCEMLVIVYFPMPCVVFAQFLYILFTADVHFSLSSLLCGLPSTRPVRLEA